MLYSYRKLDAGVDNYEVSTFKTDGLHRLERDWEKKHTVPMQAYGGNVHYTTSNLSVGFTALSYSFGKYQVQPDPKPYNLFYFRGNDNIDISVDYMFKTKRIKFYGETAMSSNKAVATLNAIRLTPVSYFLYCCFIVIMIKSIRLFSGMLSDSIHPYRMNRGFILGCSGRRLPVSNCRRMRICSVSPG